MNIAETELPGCLEIEMDRFTDARGAFVKVVSGGLYESRGISLMNREVFFSESKRGVIRGMHFQVPPTSQAKLVFPIVGEIIDVALDLRAGSKHAGAWVSRKLTAENRKALYIPVGFAHGFQALSDTAVVGYLVSSDYSPKDDRGVRYDSFGFQWPIAEVILSERDRLHPAFDRTQLPF